MEPHGLSALEYNKAVDRQKIEPFKRGSMVFEDYNYEMYNKYILVDPEFNESDSNLPMPGGFVP